MSNEKVKELRRDKLHRMISEAIKAKNNKFLMIIDPQVVEHVRNYEKYLIDNE